jgi:hypothetical protein
LRNIIMSGEYITTNEGRHHYAELDSSAESSAAPSRPDSPGHHNIPLHIRRGRVRFNSTSEANDSANKRSSVPLRDRSISPPVTIPRNTRISPLHSRSNSYTNLLRRTPETEKEDPFSDASAIVPVLKPKPSVLRTDSISSFKEDLEGADENHEKAFSALAAQERAQRIASLVGSHSAPTSARTSLDEDDRDPNPYSTARPRGAEGYPVRFDDIPLGPMDSKRTYDGGGDDSDYEELEMGWRLKASTSSEAHKLVRAHTKKLSSKGLRIDSMPGVAPGLVSGQVTPTDERTFDEYVPRPQKYVSP